MMKDILIIGLVGVLWELLPSNGGELITVVLFLLLMVATIARTPRSNDIVVICGVGLLSELVLADGRNGVTWRAQGCRAAAHLRSSVSAVADTPNGNAVKHLFSRKWGVLSPSRRERSGSSPRAGCGQPCGPDSGVRKLLRAEGPVQPLPVAQATGEKPNPRRSGPKGRHNRTCVGPSGLEEFSPSVRPGPVGPGRGGAGPAALGSPRGGIAHDQLNPSEHDRMRRSWGRVAAKRMLHSVSQRGFCHGSRTTPWLIRPLDQTTQMFGLWSATASRSSG